MFEITPQPIDTTALRLLMSNQAAGALVTFEGWVRDHNDGKPVRSLEYEAYPALANREAQRILSEAKEKFAILSARCVHRVGPLAIGDVAVWVGVSAGHRAAAFAACEYIIDEVKRRVPIWKREVFADGSVEWVNCTACAGHHHAHQY